MKQIQVAVAQHVWLAAIHSDILAHLGKTKLIISVIRASRLNTVLNEAQACGRARDT